MSEQTYSLYGRPYPTVETAVPGESEHARWSRIARNHKVWADWYRDRGYPAEAGRCDARAARYESKALEDLRDVLG